MLFQPINDKRLSPAGISMKMPAFILILLLASLTGRATDLYWIGGSGQWSDINHWSLSSGNSGGMLSPAIPQAGDHVIFDQNSGFTTGSKTVTINQASTCHNFTVKGALHAPEFVGSILTVNGSADYQTGTALNNTIHYKSGGTETVNFNDGVSGSAAFYFMGSGSYRISGTLNSTGKIYFLSGSLDFGSSIVTTGFFDEGGCCGSVPSPAVEPRSLHLGSSVITLTDRNPQSGHQAASWVYTGTTLVAGTSQINLSKGADDGYGVTFNGKNGHSYHNVSFTSAAQPSDPSASGWYRWATGNCSIATLSFASSGYIASNCTIDTLKLARSKTYFVYGIQNINAIHNPTQACEPLWNLSGYGGTQATIKSTQPLTIYNVRLNYLKAEGPEQFTAVNGVDGGQNSAWVFTNQPKDFYWIGGGGSWNDPTHWTTHADGTPSGGCLPTRNDNVYFTRFSGEISSAAPVIVNSPDAECKNIMWNGVPGNPVFKTSHPKDILSIFGSSTWQGGMLYQIATTRYMGIDTGITLTSNGVSIQGDTYFLSAGQWMLTDAFSSPQNDVFFRNGHLNTNSKPFTVRIFDSVAAGIGIRTLTLGSSTIRVNGSWNYISYRGPAVHLNAGTSRIDLTGNGAFFYYQSGLAYHDLTFTDPIGTGNLYAPLYSSTTPCTFNTLKFGGNAALNSGGNPTPVFTENLHLSASKKYVLGTIMEMGVGNLHIDGSACVGFTEIVSSSPITKARLNVLNPVQISNAKMSGIHATGSALTVTGGLDGGNNLNVVITPASPRNFYWIGGSGNWSDPKHWTPNADGTRDSLNSCLPSAIDHVFFRRDSGRDYTVTLDIPAHCHTMTWEEVAGSKPTLKAISANPLNINGSLTLQAGMDYDVERTNFVGSNSGNTITTHGTRLDYSGANVSDKGVFFNNPTGSWLLTDVFSVKNFGVMDGTFDSNNQTVNADNYYAQSTSEGAKPILRLGSSIINIAGYWEGSSIFNLQAGSSTINMLGTLPSANNSGGGLYTNEFRSRPELVYHDLNFLNAALPGKIIGYDVNIGSTFNNVRFTGEASINGSNRFNTLSLGAGKNSHLMPGSTQTVSQLTATASCGTWDFDNNCISSGDGCSATAKATIKTASDVSLQNVRLSGIAITGGGAYSASGTDMGNNSGWTFIPPSGRDLYWIGGSGTWNDPAHWTSNADGTPSGGSCLPSRFDNVFFNGYSGKNPVIHIAGVAEFHDMTWKSVPGTPTIGGTLSCYGSMTLQSSLTHQGGVRFLSSDMNSTITTNGAVVATDFDVSFSGNGSYTFVDDFTTHSRINFSAGTLNTNGKTVKAVSFTGGDLKPSETDNRSLILGSSELYFTGSGEGWAYTGKHLDAGTSHIYLQHSANYFKGKDGDNYHAITLDANDNHNTILYGSITVDRLTIAPKNSTFQLEAGKTVTVNNELQMSGSNCATIGLRSTAAGRQANLCVKEGNTTYNFISIQDINASCLPLTVLPQSTNGGNTSHINFQPNPGTGIGALGPDVKICTASLPIVLDASVFMPNEHTAMQWMNLTTGEKLGTGITQSITTKGTYRIIVNYGPGCEVTDDIVVDTDQPIDLAAQIKISQPTCDVKMGSISMNRIEGITYSIDGSDFSEKTYYTLGSGRHTVLAKNEMGCVSDTLVVSIDPRPLPPTAAISYGAVEFHAIGKAEVRQTGQNGGTYSAFPLGLAIDPATGTIDLAASTPNQSYLVTYSFSRGGCSGSAVATVKINSISATIAYPLSGYCATGSVKIVQTGPSNGRYTSSPSGLQINELSGTIDLSESTPGMYTVTYTYQDGTLMSTALTTISITALPFITITSDLGTGILQGQTVTLTAMGGISYAWIGPDILSGQNTAAIQVRPARTSTYTVVAANANGCTDVKEITIHVKLDHQLIPNNVITPNGDGKNDTWAIKNIGQYPYNRIHIYDRAGRLLYYKAGYNNDWDGTLNGKPLNEDAYIFVIEPGNGKHRIRGTVSIIRD